MPSAPSNPFATRFTRPGALEFSFPDGVTAQTLIERLAAQGWWGQIVGPHGSGKSTLLQTLRAALADAGRDVVGFRQRPRERRLAVAHAETRHWSSATLVVIDGYEQLGWLSRRWIKSACRRAGAGLVATTHVDVGLPLLWTTAPSEALARQLVARLLASEERPLIDDADVSRCYQQHAGNLREMLFALFDLYESRQRAPSARL
jgi:energy-coupling factor transporter ATP-binding protein EcfA2